MRSLETKLGVRLLDRTTRSLAPTPAGEELLVRLRPAIASVAGALADLDNARERPAGRIRVSAHRVAAIYAILPRLADFARAYPDIAVELVVDDGFVDDQGRVDYVRSHLGAVLDAVESGVPVGGYFYWSFLDNFEWAWGYEKRFGIVRVEYGTQARAPKASALDYARIITTRELPATGTAVEAHRGRGGTEA